MPPVGCATIVAMHIISGRFKGVRLSKPKSGTRPTTDRTKEAVFSRLDALDSLYDARVLDLFAGTGALGLEALSRGARNLIAVESSAPAAALVRRTFGSLQRNGSWEPGMSAQVIAQRAEQFSGSYRGPAFDVIFVDPPYDLASEACAELLGSLAAGAAVGKRTLIILERSARTPEPEVPSGWRISDRRDYGETAVLFITATQP